MTNYFSEGNLSPVSGSAAPQNPLSAHLSPDLRGFFLRFFSALPPSVVAFTQAHGALKSSNLKAFISSLGHEETTRTAATRNAGVNDPELIALEYETLLGTKRRTLAAFFSTPAIVQHLVANLFKQYHNSNTILDPACGTGIYLLACFDALLPLTKSVQQTLLLLHGVDLDTTAVDITRLLLLQKAVSTNALLNINELWSVISHNIVCGNSLLEPHLSPTLGLNFSEAFPRPTLQGGFNHIIGNPPYGISRDSRIDKTELVALQSRYKPWISGKVNTYMLFMARGMELLCEGGTLHYVVPNSWLGITSARALRTKLIDNGHLVAIERFNTRVFPEPNVEALVVGLRKKSMLPEHVEIALKEYDSPSGNLLNSDRLPLLECTKTPDRRIPLFWNAATASILSRIFEHSTPLSESGLFMPRIALQAYAKGLGTPPQTDKIVREHPFDAVERVDESYLPYLQGRDISRNEVCWSGSYLSYGPWLAEPQKLEYFNGPRIVLREILGPSPYLFQAAFVDKTFLYNKSVLHILPQGECTHLDLQALLHILLSPLGSFVLKHTGRKSQRRLFPKIVSADLRDFPIPKHFTSISNLLSRDRSNSNYNDWILSPSMTDAYGLSSSQAAIVSQL